MDAKTLEKLRREQYQRLRSLAGAKSPAGVKPLTDAEVLTFARTKYLEELSDTLRVWFPRFLQESRLGRRELARVFRGGSLQLDHFARLDDMFVRLQRYARATYDSDAWIELLTLERAIVKARLSPAARVSDKNVADKLRSRPLARRRFADVGRLFFVRVRTDLAFDYMRKSPREARAIKGGRGVVVVRRLAGERTPEILYVA